jgi:hypothetical protein
VDISVKKTLYEDRGGCGDDMCLKESITVQLLKEVETVEKDK